MLTGTMTEIGGLMIIAAVSLQVLIGLKWMFARSAHGGRPEALSALTLDAQSAHTVIPADGRQNGEAPSWLGKRKFQVAMRVYENDKCDICSFYLVPLDKRPIPPFRPGQFLTFEFPALDGEHAAVRCYSLSDSPTERSYYRISVKLLPARGGSPAGLSSSHLHNGVLEGDVIEAFAPAGDFYLDQDSDRPIVLIAGGVGLTPVLSMLNWLTATRSEREVWLFYGVRNKAEHAMYDYLAQKRLNFPNLRMFIAYSRPGPGCRQGVDYNVDGHINIDLLQAVLEADNYEFYLCGPQAMMSTLRNDLSVWGVPEEDVKFEAFGPASPQTVKAPDLRAEQTEPGGFQVRFAKSDRIVQWTNGEDTLLELAEANGIKMRCSCRAGNCGTCLTALQQGSVEYIHPPTREHSAGACLPCIARPSSDIVLDI